MKKITAYLMIAFLLVVVSFGTWQLYLGNFEAAFSTVPFLLIMYFFLMSQRK